MYETSCIKSFYLFREKFQIQSSWRVYFPWPSVVLVGLNKLSIYGMGLFWAKYSWNTKILRIFFPPFSFFFTVKELLVCVWANLYKHFKNYSLLILQRDCVANLDSEKSVFSPFSCLLCFPPSLWGHLVLFCNLLLFFAFLLLSNNVAFTIKWQFFLAYEFFNWKYPWLSFH